MINWTQSASRREAVVVAVGGNGDDESEIWRLPSGQIGESDQLWEGHELTGRRIENTFFLETRE